MSPRWFKRWGWVYRPVSVVGWSATLVALVFCVHSFVAIDRHSHSASDTLYHFYPFAAPTMLGLLWFAAQTCGEAEN